jgi:hypothetical protein
MPARYSQYTNHSHSYLKDFAVQKLLVFQSLWAMERRNADGVERSLEDNIQMITEAGYDGVSAVWTDADYARRISRMLKPNGMQAEGACFPATVDDLKPVLDIATETGLHHLTIQPNARLRRLEDCMPILEGWQRLADEVDFPIYIETHRDRMTNDLLFVLDLLDSFPSLRLLGDLSHFVVGREMVLPISEENQRHMQRILDHSWAFHGRVASCEQVQVEFAFPHNSPWLDLFMSWWDYGFRSWQKRAGPDDSLAFVCELGPKPYAIAGADGNELSDRWTDALQLRKHALDIWKSSQPGNAPSQ